MILKAIISVLIKYVKCRRESLDSLEKQTTIEAEENRAVPAPGGAREISEVFFLSDLMEKELAEEMLAYRCPRYEQLPDIPLYRDQVLDALERYTAPFFSGRDEPVLTAAMINNYVKLHLIEPPVKKRYEREQLALLYCICLLKQVMSISELHSLLLIQSRSYPLAQAYDYFCAELEKALQATFATRDFSAPSSARRVTPESELVRGLALCFANKIFTLKFLQLRPDSRPD